MVDVTSMNKSLHYCPESVRPIARREQPTTAIRFFPDGILYLGKMIEETKNKKIDLRVVAAISIGLPCVDDGPLNWISLGVQHMSFDIHVVALAFRCDGIAFGNLGM